MRLGALASASGDPLAGGLKGIEKESLRIDASGDLSRTVHPVALGSALTNQFITTDFSEALLEFITGTDQDPQNTLAELEAIHRFTYAKLGDEYLWSPSMPCPLPSEADIPIAEYGSSNIGRLKHVYRQGLALRSVEFGWIARRLAVKQTRRSKRIEAQYPVADHLKIGRTNPSRILAARRHISPPKIADAGPGPHPCCPWRSAVKPRHRNLPAKQSPHPW